MAQMTETAGPMITTTDGTPLKLALARATRRSVGAAGKATYRVWRGQPKLALRGDTLSTTVPISSTASAIAVATSTSAPSTRGPR